MTRGFTKAEFETRTARAQQAMAEHGLSALLLTTEPELRYYTGYLTRFWESPTRPWFCVIPATGKPIAVIPAIGSHLMGQSWLDDIRTWNAPDYEDDGTRLLAATLQEVCPAMGQIGMAHHMESHARMPLGDLDRLRDQIGDKQIVGDGAITRSLRMIKSVDEIAKIGHAAAIAGRAFDRVSEIAAPGTPLEEVFRRFQMLCLEEGADWVPYLAGAAGPGGYQDVISPATPAPLANGDVLMLDTGLVWDGYFCDFNRNFSLGPASIEVAKAHHLLIEATEIGVEAARPGRTMADLFRAMNSVLGLAPDAGRLGHGLGMQLTEWPSIIPADQTELQCGMVLTLEPFVALPNGKLMVHEENIVIREGGAEYLSAPAAPECPVI